MQSLLGRLYDVRIGYDVYDFLVTDRRALAALTGGGAHCAVEEQLLLAQSADGAGVALYLDAELLERLEQTNPLGTLHDGNLADFCTALEGVSHFLYSTWRLDEDAPVSLLELETQAEVDKYWTTVFLLADQRGGAFPDQVHARLFDHVRFDAELDTSAHDRYQTANRCAAQYCRRLQRRFVTRGEPRIEALLRDLRKFYRLEFAAKMRHALG